MDFQVKTEEDGIMGPLLRRNFSRGSSVPPAEFPHQEVLALYLKSRLCWTQQCTWSWAELLSTLQSLPPWPLPSAPTPARSHLQNHGARGATAVISREKRNTLGDEANTVTSVLTPKLALLTGGRCCEIV